MDNYRNDRCNCKGIQEMKNIIKFIVFIMYTIYIFFVSDFRLLAILFLLNFLIAIYLKINLKKMIYNLIILFPFIMFTGIINIIFDSLIAGILISIRIVICYNVTYVFSKTMTVSELANTIKNLCCPLKLFKINTENIGIMVLISICMIPVFKSELYSVIQAMKSKGKMMRISSITIIMKPILISVLKKTNEIEKTLVAKGYECE